MFISTRHITNNTMFLTPLLSSRSVNLFIGGNWRGVVNFEGLLQVKSDILSRIQVYTQFPTTVVSSYSYFKAKITNISFCISCIFCNIYIHITEIISVLVNLSIYDKNTIDCAD